MNDRLGTVIVVGSANVDLLFQLARLPRPGETVAGGTLVRAFGGKGANQAAAAASLGAQTYLVARVGEDDAGRSSRAALNDVGVDVSHVTASTEVGTGTAAVFVAPDGANMIGVAAGANEALSCEHVTAAFDAIRARRAVVLASLEVPLATVEHAAELSVQRGYRFVLNPAPAQPLSSQMARFVSLLTPNESEVTALGFSSVAAILDAGVGGVIVTKGSAGAELHAEQRRETFHVHHYAIDVKDTTGAGDVFNGALAWALASGHELSPAVRMATAAASLSTEGIGARSALPGPERLFALLRGTSPDQ